MSKDITAMQELLPCPFCGKAPEWINLMHPSGIPAIQCPECQFSMQQDRRDKTIFYWNRRTAQQSIKEDGFTVTNFNGYSDVQNKSLELLQKFVDETPKEELSAILKKHQSNDSNGITFDEYLNRLPGVKEDRWIKTEDFFPKVDEEILGINKENEIAICYRAESKRFYNIDGNRFYPIYCQSLPSPPTIKPIK